MTLTKQTAVKPQAAPARPALSGVERGVVDRASDEAQGRSIQGRSKQVDLASRTVRFIASTNEVDRHGEVVLPSAFKARLEKFERHSPFLAAHQPWVEAGHPTQIGTVKAIEITDSDVRIEVRYAETDAAEEHWKLARDIEQSVAVSIGFIPIKWLMGPAAALLEELPELEKPFGEAHLADDKRVRVYTEIELLEVSQVSVPANSGAVQLGSLTPVPVPMYREDRADDPAITSRGVVVGQEVRTAVEAGMAELRQYLAAEIEEIKLQIAEFGFNGGALEAPETTPPSRLAGTDAPETNGETEKTIGVLQTLIEDLKETTNSN